MEKIPSINTCSLSTILTRKKEESNKNPPMSGLIADLYLQILHKNLQKFIQILKAIIKRLKLHSDTTDDKRLSASTTTNHIFAHLSMEERNTIGRHLAERGQNPLCYALKMDAREIVNWLIDSQLAINVANGKANDYDRFTPLHMAIRFDRTDAILRLLDCATLNPNQDIGSPYFTPLQHLFISFRDYHSMGLVVRRLISHANFQMPIKKRFSLLPQWILRERHAPLRATAQTIDFLLNCGFPLFGARKPENRNKNCGDLRTNGLPTFAPKIENFLDAAFENRFIDFGRLIVQAENSYGQRFVGMRLRTLAGSEISNQCFSQPLSLKQLARVIIRARLLSTGRPIVVDRLESLLPQLPQILLLYIYDISLH